MGKKTTQLPALPGPLVADDFLMIVKDGANYKGTVDDTATAVMSLIGAIVYQPIEGDLIVNGTIHINIPAGWTGQLTRNGASIPGAISGTGPTTLSYVLTIADVGKQLAAFLIPPDVTVPFTDPLLPEKSVDMDFVRDDYTHDLALMGLTEADVVTGGAVIMGLPVEHIGPWSKSPNSYVIQNPTNGMTKTTPYGTDADGFTPARLASLGYGTYLRQTSLRALAIGERFIVAVRYAQSGSEAMGGVRFRFGGCVGNTVWSANPNIATPLTLESGSSVSKLGQTTNGDGSITAYFLGTATNAVALTVDCGTYGEGILKYWGADASIGDAPTPWVTVTTSIVTVTGAIPVLDGELEDFAKAPAGSLAFELSDADFGASSYVYSAGATGVEQEIIKVLNLCRVAVKTIEARVGQSGLWGISRMAFAYDETGWSFSFNGGKLISSNTPLPARTGLISICRGINAQLRRFEMWPVRISDEDVVLAAEIRNRPLPDSGTMLNPGLMVEAFVDHFDQYTLTYRGGDPNVFPPGTHSQNIGRYTGKPGLGGPGVPGNWMGRSFAWSSPYGNPSTVINNEDILYVDPEITTNGADWGGWTGPLEWDLANSELVITTCLLSQLPAGAQAQLPAEFYVAGASGPKKTTKWVGGMVSAPHKFRDKVNSYSELLAKWPGINVPGIWSGGWLYDNGNTAELDIIEPISSTSFILRQHGHMSNFAINWDQLYTLPFVYGGDYYTYGSWRTASWVRHYFCGRLTGQTTANAGQDSAFNNRGMAPMINTTINGNYALGMGPAADSTTDAGAPYKTRVDYWKTWNQA